MYPKCIQMPENVSKMYPNALKCIQNVSKMYPFYLIHHAFAIRFKIIEIVLSLVISFFLLLLHL